MRMLALSKADRAILAMTQSDIDRFWSRVDKTPGHGPKGECQLWVGRKGHGGYGSIALSGTPVLAHRVAFFLENGHLPPPEAPLSLHSCDFPPCVRGEHLWAGTDADNAADRGAKGRQARGERMGNARLTDAQCAEIRDLYAAGEGSARVLAQRFGASVPTVSALVLGTRRGAGVDATSRRRIARANILAGCARGESHCRAKLTDANVASIRAAYPGCGLTQRQIAALFGVTRGTIGRVLRGSSWAHAEAPPPDPRALDDVRLLLAGGTK